MIEDKYLELLKKLQEEIRLTDQRIKQLYSLIGGSTTFIGLLDTPDSYIGQAGKVTAVKTMEDGLEFVAAGGGGATTFLELTDTPASYVGHGDKQVKVNAAANALEFGRRIFVSDLSPGAGDGSDGDIWLEY